MMPDLKDPSILRFKGLLFLVGAALASALLLAEGPSWKAGALLALALWCACRFYYFAFYVLERYADPAFRYAGLLDLSLYLLRGGRGQGSAAAPPPAAAHLILYVADQARSAAFYSGVLGSKPRLDVPGMTEFELGPGRVLGLMPESGTKRLLGASLPDPAQARGVPRAELYLLVGEPASFHARALERGARELSPLTPRDWGHEAAYSLDPDGHVLAFARETRRL